MKTKDYFVYKYGIFTQTSCMERLFCRGNIYPLHGDNERCTIATERTDHFVHLVIFHKERIAIATVDRRKLIVQAAARSFSIFGYKATTMDKVAKDANVGKGTIYTFFADKEELFKAIMSDYIVQMKEVADEVIDRSISFFDNVQNVLMAMIHFREHHELTIQLTHELRAIGTPAAEDALKSVEQVIVSYIKQEVEAALVKGEIRPCDPEITAFIMLKMYVAFVSEWGKSHGKLSNEELAKLFHLYLGQGLDMGRE